MTLIRAWHSTSATFDAFAPFSHFGSRAQAEMRRNRGGRLLQVEFSLPSCKTMRDTGAWNIKTLRALERRGLDGITYLNRFEGISLEAFESARAAFGDIDRLSDGMFRKAIKEAADSWIVFDPARIRIIDIVEAQDVPRFEGAFAKKD